MYSRIHPRAFPLSLSLSLSLSLFLFPLSLSRSLNLSLARFLSLSLFLSVCFSPAHSLALALSHHFSLAPSLCLSLSLSLSFAVPPCCLYQLTFLSRSLSRPRAASLFLSRTISLSLSVSLSLIRGPPCCLSLSLSCFSRSLSLYLLFCHLVYVHILGSGGPLIRKATCFLSFFLGFWRPNLMTGLISHATKRIHLYLDFFFQWPPRASRPVTDLTWIGSRSQCIWGMHTEILDGHPRSLFEGLIWKETWTLTIEDLDFRFGEHFGHHTSLFKWFIWKEILTSYI